MGIPRIAPYPMPEPASFPASRLRSRFDASRAALLVHDVQKHFVGFYDASAAPVTGLVANIRALLGAARELGVPVFYTAQPREQSAEERGLLNETWGAGITAGPGDAAEILPALAPREGEVVLTKWRYSAFQRSDFAEQLGARGRDQLIITGVYAHIGCQLTAAEAFMRDVRPFFVGDAVADFSREEHEAAIRYVADCCGTVTSTEALLEAMASAASANQREESP